MAKGKRIKAFEQFLGEASRNRSSGKFSIVAELPSEVLNIIDRYIEANASRTTTRTIPEFYEYLVENYNVTFCISTLRNYYERFQPTLWKERSRW